MGWRVMFSTADRWSFKRILDSDGQHTDWVSMRRLSRFIKLPRRPRRNFNKMASNALPLA